MLGGAGEPRALFSCPYCWYDRRAERGGCVLKPIFRYVVAGVILALGAACATSDPGNRYGTEPSISIPYDPYDYDPDDLLAEAQAHCGALNMTARFDGETVDPQSVRWRYRHYRCI